jgi:hypothetical protein
LRSVQRDLRREGKDDLLAYLKSNRDTYLAFIQEQMKSHGLVASPASLSPYLPSIPVEESYVDAPAGLTDAQHVQIIEKTVQAMKNPRRNRRRPVRRNAYDPGTGEITYGVDVGRVWKSYSDNTYTAKRSNLVVLATREALQNGVDAIRQAVRKGIIRKGSGEFRVTTDHENSSITWEDNGIGMNLTVLGKFTDMGATHGKESPTGELDLQVRRYKRPPTEPNGNYYFRLNGLFQFKRKPYSGDLKYDYVFDWTSKGAGGGFGIAKAVLLGISSNFKWDIHTNDIFMASESFEGASRPETVTPRIGTKLTVYNVDLTDENYTSVEERIRDMLAYNYLPDIKLYLNGKIVKPYFSGRRGTKVGVEKYGFWGDNPVAGEPGYPFLSSREGLDGDIDERAFWGFQKMAEKDETPVRSVEDEVFDPGDPYAIQGMSAAQRKQLQEIEKGVEDALDSPDMKELLQSAAEVQVAFQKAGWKQQENLSKAKGESRAPGAPTVGIKGPISRSPLQSDEDEADLIQALNEGKSLQDVAQKLRETIESQDVVSREAERFRGEATVVATPEAREALNDIAEGVEISGEQVEALVEVLTNTATQATTPGGGGLQQVATVQTAVTALIEGIEAAVDEAQGTVRAEESDTPALPIRSVYKVEHALKEAKKRKELNPFGNLAGLYIAKKYFLNSQGKYDSQRARNFKKNYAKWLPYLMFWDATLRFIARRVGINQTVYVDPFKPGFILNDELLGLYTLLESGTQVIYINPYSLRDAARIFKNDPLALAQFAMNIGVHEMAHMITGTKHSDDEYSSHGSKWAIEREAMGNLMAPVLPGVALLAEQYLGLKRPLSPDTKRAQAEAKAELKKLKAQHKSELGKLQRKAAKLETKLTTSCPKCYKELIKALKEGGNLSTVTWLQQKAG